MIEVKKGQRWLYKGSYASVIIEVLSDRAISATSYTDVSGMVLQNVIANEWLVGGIQGWNFGGDIQSRWTYLVGQDAPQK